MPMKWRSWKSGGFSASVLKLIAMGSGQEQKITRYVFFAIPCVLCTLAVTRYTPPRRKEREEARNKRKERPA